jgi:hypothetical protein
VPVKVNGDGFARQHAPHQRLDRLGNRSIGQGNLRGLSHALMAMIWDSRAADVEPRELLSKGELRWRNRAN